MRQKIKTIALLALAFSFYSCSSPDAKLPIYGERSTEERLVDGKTQVDTIYQTIPDFSLLNQDSVLIGQKNFESKIYIANFFFTHCPSICPTMQRNLLKFYKKYKGDERLSFLSHSIDFKNDSPYVLKEYANNLGVDSPQWQFVGGSKTVIYGLAEKYLVYAKEDANVAGGYDHQGYLVLIDQQKRIRGAYDGTDEQQVAKLFVDLEILLDEK